MTSMSSDDIPKLFQSTAKLPNHHPQSRSGTKHNSYLAASYARAEWVVTDTDLLVDDVVRKVVLSTSHCPDEHSDVVCFG